MNISLLIRLSLSDPDGRVVWRSRRRRSRSFVANFARFIRILNSDTTATVTNLAGTAILCQKPAAAVGRYLALTGSAGFAFGTRVGTGTVAPVPGDTTLGAIINEGSASGQMQHGVVSFGAITIVAQDTTYTVTRAFTNASGATITVQEAGLICLWRDTGNTDHDFLIVRDLTGVVAVDNARTLTVEYTLKVTT